MQHESTALASIAALPKADVHVHAETSARVDRILAQRAGEQPCDWRSWIQRMQQDIPPGTERLLKMNGPLQLDDEYVKTLDLDPDFVTERITDILAEAAVDGALLVEVIFGGGTIGLPHFMTSFRRAEAQVQEDYPDFCAEAIIAAMLPKDPERDQNFLTACIEVTDQGLAGINIIPQPYSDEADWSQIYPWAERAASAGLGIAIHAGEFSEANLSAALKTPGVSRIGHAVYATSDESILKQLADSSVTVESPLTCNVVLGATESYATHPLRQFVDCGIPVTLCTDDPLRMATTIEQEYNVAAEQGFSLQELRQFTYNGIAASFTNADQRARLLNMLETTN